MVIGWLAGPRSVRVAGSLRSSQSLSFIGIGLTLQPTRAQPSELNAGIVGAGG